MGDSILGRIFERTEGFFGADALSRYGDMAIVAVPVMAGLVVGDASRDLRQRAFSFLLPGLGRSLLLGTAAMAIAFSAAAALGHGVWLGSRAPLALGTTAFLAFAYGASLMDRPLGTAVLLATWSGAIVAAYSAGAVLDAAQARPWLSSALSIGIGGFLIHNLHARGFHRRLVARGAFLSIFHAFDPIEQARHRAERTAHGGERTLRLPRAPASGHSGWSTWVRLVRAGDWNGRTPLLVLWAVGAVLSIAVVALLDGWEEDGTARTAWTFLHHTLLDPREGLPYENRPPYYLPGLLLACWMWFVGGASAANLFGLRWVYPLSRAERARIAHRVLSIDSAVFVLVAVLGLTLAAMASAQASGEWADLEFWRGRMPLYVWQVALVVAIVPLVLACQVVFQASQRIGGGRMAMLWSGVAVCVLAMSMALAEKLQREWVNASGGAWPALLLLVAIVAGQAWLRSRLERHFSRVDLA
jgi:hypothetical protein